VETLRFGVLSTARIGVTRVIPALQRSQRCEVVAIASRDEDRANTAAQQLGIATSHSSYEALLADPDVDAVYNPLPNHLHAPWTLAAAEAGKHVLCEKPLAMDAAEAQHMVEGCREAGVVLVEAFMYRMHPQWVRVRELIADGTLGELRAVHSVFSYHNTDPDDIRNIADYGGGGLMDIGCYCIDVSRMLLGGEPVAARGEVQIDATFGTDVLATGLLRFDDDREALVLRQRDRVLVVIALASDVGRAREADPHPIERERHAHARNCSSHQDATLRARGRIVYHP
jgi:predicted dehydrogenase